MPGSIVGAGAGLAALICTAALAPLVIALGWLWCPPLIGIAVLAVGAAATWSLTKFTHRSVAQRAAPSGT